MTTIRGNDASKLIGRAAGEAFVQGADAKGGAARLQQEYASFLQNLTGGAKKEFDGFVRANAPDLAALLRLPKDDSGPSPALQRALESAFATAGDKLRFTPASGAPFYGAHFPPVDVQLGGETFKVYVSAEEQRFGPPSTPEQSNAAILERKDGSRSTDLALRF